MNANRFLTTNGNWSLFVIFSPVNVAQGNVTGIPSPLAHPFRWEVISNGKKVAWGTAPVGDFYRYGIHERGLVELLGMTSGDHIDFYDRKGNVIDDRFTLANGWTSQQPAALQVKLEALKKYAVTDAQGNPRTVTRKKAAK